VGISQLLRVHSHDIAAARLPPAQVGALNLYPPINFTVTALVDNFDPSNNHTFQQRVLQYDRWWSSGGPIFLYLGGEGSIEGFYNYTGAVFEHAKEFNAMVVFIEHRYYGRSQPYAINSELAPYHGLTIDQAMADLAWFLWGFRQRLNCAADECPVITFGGSYGGMLVAWFRQKYPQLTSGGLAMGAPVDFYPRDGRQADFWNATLHTFEKYGAQGCSSSLDSIVDSLYLLLNIANSTERRRIGKLLASCDDMSKEDTMAKKVDMYLRGVVSSLAMLDYPEPSTFVTQLPAEPVAVACKCLDGRTPVESARRLIDLYLNGSSGFKCYDYLAEVVGRPTLGKLRGPLQQPDMGPWQYQACTQILMEPLTSDGFGFYPPADDQLEEVKTSCRLRFGAEPRPDWLPMSFGASDLRVGELFFSDGEKDPWRTGAVKTHLLRQGLDIHHIIVKGAAHHEDLRFDSVPSKESVVQAKRMAQEAIKRWLGIGTQSSATVVYI
jgi:dipeptidyl-peptidase-2